MLILQALLQFLNSYGEQIVYRGSGEGKKKTARNSKPTKSKGVGNVNKPPPTDIPRPDSAFSRQRPSPGAFKVQLSRTLFLRGSSAWRDNVH